MTRFKGGMSAFLATIVLAAGVAFVQAVPAYAQVDMSCIVRADMVPLEGRASTRIKFRLAHLETDP